MNRFNSNCSSQHSMGNTPRTMGSSPYQMRSNNTAVNSSRNMSRRQDSCGCTADTASNERQREDDWRQNVPTGNQTQLLTYIDQVSFGAYEALLYLDTHPDDADAMQYFRENNEKRNFALREHARLYGPLNLMNVGKDCSSSWEWVNQPWPWEGGNC